MRTINEQCVGQLNGELDESYIQEIMRPEGVRLTENIMTLQRQRLRCFAKEYITQFVNMAITFLQHQLCLSVAVHLS